MLSSTPHRLLCMLLLGAALLVLRSGVRAVLPVPPIPLVLADPSSLDREILIDQGLRADWSRTDPVIRARLIDNMRFTHASGVSSDDAELLERALALGMERKDPLVRARLAARSRTLLERVDDPSEAALRRFVADHSERFRTPAIAVIRQEFLGNSRDGAGGADGGVLSTLERELTGTRSRIAARLGPGFADGAFALAPGATAELESSYGKHRVTLVELREGSVPPFESVRAAARQAWIEQRKPEVFERRMAELRMRYEVVSP